MKSLLMIVLPDNLPPACAAAQTNQSASKTQAAGQHAVIEHLQ